MNAVLTEPVFVDRHYGDWSSLDWIFRSRFFLIWDRGPLFSLRYQRALYILWFLFSVFQVCLVVFFSFGNRGPVTSGSTFLHIGMFKCFLICSCQLCGGPRAVKVAMATRFPFLQAGHLRCIGGAVSGSSGLPSTSCNSGMTVLL